MSAPVNNGPHSVSIGTAHAFAVALSKPVNQSNGLHRRCTMHSGHVQISVTMPLSTSIGGMFGLRAHQLDHEIR